MIIPYSAVVFLLIMRLLPEEPQFSQVGFFKRTSSSTYHILLVQAVLFSILYYSNPGMLIGEVVFNLETYLILFVIIISISFTIGCIWKNTERKLAN
jgi:hypothetical protein